MGGAALGTTFISDGTMLSSCGSQRYLQVGYFVAVPKLQRYK